MSFLRSVSHGIPVHGLVGTILARRWLDRRFAHGLVRRDGAVIGAFLKVDTSRDLARGVVRSPCGRRLVLMSRREHQWLPVHVMFGSGDVEATLRDMLRVLDDGEQVEAVVQDALLDRLPGTVDPASIARSFVGSMRRTIDAFLATLDPVALDLVRQGCQRYVPYDSYDRTLGGSPTLAALTSTYPTIYRLLRRRWDDALQDLPRDAECRDEWDAVARAALRETTDLPGWAVSHAPKVNDLIVAAWDDTKGSIDGSLVRELATLARMPSSWAPRTAREWTDYGMAMPVLREAARLLHDEGDLPSLIASKGRWAEWQASLRPWIDRGVAPRTTVADAWDVARAFEAQVLSPALVLAGAYPVGNAVAVDVMWSGLSLKAVLEWSHRWHLARTAIEARIASLRGGNQNVGGTWSAGIPDHCGAGLWLHVATTPAELVAEGAEGARDGRAGLHHCVGGYGSECRSGRSRIVSVRRIVGEDDWERVSTASLKVDGPVVEVLDHRGARNRAPDRGADAVLRDYVAALGDGRLAVDREALRPVWEPLMTSEYDWRAEGAWEAVADAWWPCLPRRIRDLGRAALARLVSAPGTHLRGGWHPTHLLDGR